MLRGLEMRVGVVGVVLHQVRARNLAVQTNNDVCRRRRLERRAECLRRASRVPRQHAQIPHPLPECRRELGLVRLIRPHLLVEPLHVRARLACELGVQEPPKLLVLSQRLAAAAGQHMQTHQPRMPAFVQRVGSDQPPRHTRC
jgi:hypothetical protein